MSFKIFAIGCIHGVLKKEISLTIKKEGPDAILVSGDFTGSIHDDEVRKYEKELVENFGPVPHLWPLKVQIESEKKFMKWGKISAENTAKVFNDLDKIGLPVYYVHGNWDSVSSEGKGMFEGSAGFFIDKVKGKNLNFVHEKIVKINGFSIVGFGGYRGASVKEYLCGDVPDHVMDHILQIRDDMRKRMERLFSGVRDRRKSILLTHDPPYKLHDWLDLAKRNYGEKVTRDIIEKHRPAVCVCSHFHEHQGVGKIKDTVVVNSGYGREGQCAIVNIDDEVKVRLLKL
jgi:Icc-related predicted phosphoesterase